MSEQPRGMVRYFCHQCGKEATYVPQRAELRFGGKTTTRPAATPMKRVTTCPHCGAANELALR